MLLLNLVKELGVAIKVTKAGAIHIYDPLQKQKPFISEKHWVWNPTTFVLRKRDSYHGGISAKNVDSEEKLCLILRQRILKYRV